MPAGDEPKGADAVPAWSLGVEGGNLEHIVRDRGPMQVAQAVDCVIQAARQLEACHARGMVHGHIRPDNLTLDQAGTVCVLDLGTAGLVDTSKPQENPSTGRHGESGIDSATTDYTAPEQAADPCRVDHRADIYSMGCTLYYLLTGKVPFSGKTIEERLVAQREHPAPSLRIARSDVSPALDAAYLRMVAKRADDRPASVTEVIALLEPCKSSAIGAEPPAAPLLEPELDHQGLSNAPRQTTQPKTGAVPSMFVRPREKEGALIDDVLNIEDLVLNARPEDPPNALPTATRRAPPKTQRLRQVTTRLARGRLTPQPLVWLAGAAIVAVGVAIASLMVFHRGDQPKPSAVKTAVPAPDRHVALSVPPPPDVTTKIFDGKTGDGWMLCERNRPVPASNIRRDGLNPHGTGSYLVVYHQMVSDFVLDFEYKLTKGCNTGVFLRVSDLKLPVQTGIEVAIDDTAHGGDEDSGGFFGLVAPRVFAQRPTGEWNHMTITARGPRLSVSLNGTEVSLIDLDQWRVPGKRPDGSNHRFKHVAIASLARTGYLGFQDLGGDCWFKNIYLTSPASVAVASPGRRVAGKTSPPRP